MLKLGSFKFVNNKAIIYLNDRVCDTPEELIESEMFYEVIIRFVKQLKARQSPLIGIFAKPVDDIEDPDIDALVQTLRNLTKLSCEEVSRLDPEAGKFVKKPMLLQNFIESLYNFWREFERFIVCDSTGDRLDKRPYRTFNATIESLTHLVRQTYRDIEENITGQHPNIYRQVRAGAEVAVIALPKDIKLPAGSYQKLKHIPVIRQILLYPPLLLNPPMNKRTGKFERISVNPLEQIEFSPNEWLCYPAKVGPLLILIYVHQTFYDLGFTLGNLFELAEDAFLNRPADAVYIFGVPGTILDALAPMPTVFYDDTENRLIAGFCPNRDEFGYFGYLKKMVLTLHNIQMMKQDKMPYHGALVKIVMKGNYSKTLLIIGDTGTGKSETLEAFRMIGEHLIEEICIIADDMGSLEINQNGEVIGYGTEIGAFVRLDDLQPGYAFGQLDRAIIMNPNQVNARVVLPVTTYENVIQGTKIDMVLYANNFEEIDEEHPVIQRFTAPDLAMHTFREGTAMSKGTTTSTGLVHTYFVNVFGAVQYRAQHEVIAGRFFQKFFQIDLFVGQLRTRLGIAGWERKGPEEAARALLELISAQHATRD